MAAQALLLLTPVSNLAALALSPSLRLGLAYASFFLPGNRNHSVIPSAVAKEAGVV